MVTILQQIMETKRKEVEAAKRCRPIEDLLRGIDSAEPVRDFRGAVLNECMSLIAEIKQKSPSAGSLLEEFDPAAIARTYGESGASAISVAMRIVRPFMSGSSCKRTVKRPADAPSRARSRC